MLNDADRYQGGGGNAGDEALETLNDADALFSNLKRWIKADYNSKTQVTDAKRPANISTLAAFNFRRYTVSADLRTIQPCAILLSAQALPPSLRRASFPRSAGAFPSGLLCLPGFLRFRGGGF
jgi:hypothetical protein